MEALARDIKLRILLHNERAQNKLLIRAEEDRQIRLEADKLTAEKDNIEKHLKWAGQTIDWDTLVISVIPNPEQVPSSPSSTQECKKEESHAEQPIRNRRSTGKRHK